jgi:death-on-curing family protein
MIKDSQTNRWNELEIKMQKMEMNEKFANQIIKLIYAVHEIVPTIRTSDIAESQDYSVQFSQKIEGVVTSLVNMFSYENKGILEFISLLLIRIARAHAWHNGNKRTAIVSVSKLLSTLGYYII